MSAWFGVYNDVAVAISWLLGQGAERIAYVDIDVHYGDGVRAAFWADLRVLTISVHPHPATLFSFTGLPQRLAGRARRGRRSMSRCPPGAAMLPGCVPSTRSSLRCCGGSGR